MTSHCSRRRAKTVDGTRHQTCQRHRSWWTLSARRHVEKQRNRRRSGFGWPQWLVTGADNERMFLESATTQVQRQGSPSTTAFSSRRRDRTKPREHTSWCCHGWSRTSNKSSTTRWTKPRPFVAARHHASDPRKRYQIALTRPRFPSSRRNVSPRNVTGPPATKLFRLGTRSPPSLGYSPATTGSVEQDVVGIGRHGAQCLESEPDGVQNRPSVGCRRTIRRSTQESLRHDNASRRKVPIVNDIPGVQDVSPGHVPRADSRST